MSVRPLWPVGAIVRPQIHAHGSRYHERLISVDCLKSAIPALTARRQSNYNPQVHNTKTTDSGTTVSAILRTPMGRAAHLVEACMNVSGIKASSKLFTYFPNTDPNSDTFIVFIIAIFSVLSGYLAVLSYEYGVH